MSRHIAKHTEEILVEWYATVSRWQPPGEGSSVHCTLCVESGFSAQLGFSRWPHSVTHSLVANLTALASDAAAREQICVLLLEHELDIDDVLEQCIDHRLSRFVRDQATAAVAIFGTLTESDRSAQE